MAPYCTCKCDTFSGGEFSACPNHATMTIVPAKVSAVQSFEHNAHAPENHLDNHRTRNEECLRADQTENRHIVPGITEGDGRDHQRRSENGQDNKRFASALCNRQLS